MSTRSTPQSANAYAAQCPFGIPTSANMANSAPRVSVTNSVSNGRGYSSMLSECLVLEDLGVEVPCSFARAFGCRERSKRSAFSSWTDPSS
eukprot:680994-Rhodomonas_salina.3